MLETELKCMLSEETYLKLVSMFNWDSIKEQTNSYYSDSENTLKKSGITFRIRTIDNISKIQIKQHKNSNSPLQVCEETEYDTESIPKHFSADHVEQLTGIHTDVSLLGSLTTLRHSFMYNNSTEICLDKSTYLDRTDYEIEIEYTESVPSELMEKLKDAGVSFGEPAVGKCTRFMIRLFEMINGK